MCLCKNYHHEFSPPTQFYFPSLHPPVCLSGHARDCEKEVYVWVKSKEVGLGSLVHMFLAARP